VRRSGAHRRVVAWLAFAAIWLAVVVPVISRVMATPAAAPVASGMTCGEHMGHGTDPADPDPRLPATDKCGYCTLIGHSPALLAAAWVPVLLPRTAHLPPCLPDEWCTRRHSLLAATPRGPPGFVNA
jgi:hypothetical protein